MFYLVSCLSDKRTNLVVKSRQKTVLVKVLGETYFRA
jgi:hypothetical protein